MQKQTPKWLDLFLTAFGPSGLVALAWWAGAFHAQRIREWQTSYPILQITGEAAAGKSTLVSNLWKLVGTPEPDHISVNTCSMGTLLAILARAVNRPVVIEESGRPDDCFDWAALRECYAGGAVLRRIGDHTLEGFDFKGALAFVGGYDQVLNQRIVNIHLLRQPRTDAHLNAVQALYDLHLGDFTEFLATVQESREQVAYRLGHVRAYVDSLKEDTENDIRDDVARNHAQLRALLDLLADLFPIPAKALHEAHCLVSEMAWTHVTLKTLMADTRAN
ncbi:MULTISPECIES: hypothetical protein [Pseudomonas]|uniref:hypothetical protein n=1 Tax=Pseudomonas TaxID=286 RepID=UPI0021F18373|nr:MULTISPECIES: hypothetical protein [Pseudomonas]MCV6429395.1 hypothetical protein [Pseudomonas aeruginosa]MCV6437373.1 hypothetical protein [Pseudomonas aeruginosa]MCW5273898.1 hypothetical protein [Pseudomonas aeruginosa]MDU4251426.1 hypothetical protein [Pseudomonas sp.]